MTEMTRANDEHDRRWKRAWWAALIGSVVLHVLILLAFRNERPLPPSPFAAAGPRAGDDQAAAGGGTQVIAMRIAQPQVVPPDPVVPEPIVEPVIEQEKEPEPEPEVEPVVAVTSEVDGRGEVGQGVGKAQGAGVEGGTGQGDGGTSDEGLFRVLPPSPLALIIPPADRPSKVRGKEVDVWVFVNTRGRVVPDSTRIAPSTGDRKFDTKLREQAAEWVFQPARRGNQAVAEWFRYTIVL